MILGPAAATELRRTFGRPFCHKPPLLARRSRQLFLFLLNIRGAVAAFFSYLQHLQGVPKKLLSELLDLALIMGACLNTLCTSPAMMSSQLAVEVLSPAIQKVTFLGNPVYC